MAEARQPAKKPAQQSAGFLDPVMAVLTRNWFFRWSWPRMLNANLIMGVALLMSLTLNTIQIFRQPDPKYFATMPDGSILPLVALNKPYVSSETVLQFAEKSLKRSFTFDFDEKNIREHFEELKSDYTEDGYMIYLDGMKKAQFMDKIRREHLISSAVASGASVISWEGIDKQTGVYAWDVQIPLSVSFSSQTGKKSYDFFIKQRIQRIPTIQNPRGIATSYFRITSNPQLN